MIFGYFSLDELRKSHPAWRLLCADYAPFIASFLHRQFITTNRREIPQSELEGNLREEILNLREKLGKDNIFPQDAHKYLDEWADDDNKWLRKFHQDRDDEPYFDLTSATETALIWLEGLATEKERAFIGTESRLHTMVDLLRRTNEQSQTKPEIRLAALQKRRDAIDDEIACVIEGNAQVLDDRTIKERFQEFMAMSRGLLGDFRKVEENFRLLDQNVREKITTWKGPKGELVGSIFHDQDSIEQSDQGKSLQAFWNILSSPAGMEELEHLLEQMAELSNTTTTESPIDIADKWRDAAGHTVVMERKLVDQLRKFLDTKTLLSNRRTMEIIQEIEIHATKLRDNIPPADSRFMFLDDISATIELPQERPLFQPPRKTALAQTVVKKGDEEDVDISTLYSHNVVNKDHVARTIREELERQGQITLAEIIRRRPLRNGLAELVVYLQLIEDSFKTVQDDGEEDRVEWPVKGTNRIRVAILPRIIFIRS